MTPKRGSDWGEPEIINRPVSIQTTRRGKVVEYLRNAVVKLKPTSRKEGYVPHVELKCKDEGEARSKFSALYAARKRLQEEGPQYRQLKFKLQSSPEWVIFIWLQKEDSK